VVLASATSWTVLQLLPGNHPPFEVPQYPLVHPAEFALYAVLGVAGGLVSAVFTRLLLGLGRTFLAAPRRTVWFLPAAGGLLVGMIGWFVPQNLGVGYKYVGDALNGHMVWKVMALLLRMQRRLEAAAATAAESTA
jgi:CIC family chloride channel protein